MSGVDSGEIDRLPNGLCITAAQVKGTQGCAVVVQYRAGFRTDPPNRAGLAHLFEHMMFQGSASVPPGGHFEELLAVGGAVNGNTFPDVADYHQMAPVGLLDRILALEADRMAHLRLSRDNLDRQREVVKEEIRLRVHGKPYGGFPWTVLPAVLYQRWANGHNGFGDFTDLDRVTLADCRDYYQARYAPGQAVVAVCADRDPHSTLRAIRAHFEHLPARPSPAVPALTESPRAEQFAVHSDPLAPHPAFAMGWTLPDPGRDLTAYAGYVVLTRLLTGGAHGRLTRALAARNARADTSPGLFGPLMSTDPDTFVLVLHHTAGDEDACRAIVFDTLTEVATGAIPAGEIERAVAAMTSDLYLNLDSLAYRARMLARGVLLFDDPALTGRFLTEIEQMSEPAVRAAAERLLAPTGRAHLTLVPGAPA
ncbi:M16 family metallopeptidase [Nocardia sp. NPDC051570]|uniref:M16 family metallopeptidase n=1 Tax=Nocardia sp. NPDC051570 TaxID=3364324 RepID=UPI0037A73A73